MSNPKRVKIEVYLTEEVKARILEKAKELDLSLSDYMKLKALDLLNEKQSSLEKFEGGKKS